MSTFGRYFSQLQFLSILTVYFFWMTVRGTGPVSRKYLWLTAVAFMATFLTWEAAALIAPGMVVAAIVHRRKRLGTLVLDGSVWLAMLAVLLVVVAQYSHTVLQQTKFLWYGTSLSDVNLRPMWQYPTFKPWYYVWESSWNQDALFPMLGLAAAMVLAIRHPFRQRLRFLLLVYLGACLSLSMLLPATAWRYIHHMAPLQVLLASASLVAVARGLARVARRRGLPAWWAAYARGVGLTVALVLVALASGMTVRLPDLPGFRIEAYTPAVLKFPNLETPTRYVCEHYQPGDVVFATDPFQVTHLMRQLGRPDLQVDFWPESALRHPATLDDRRSLPLDRRDGTPQVPDLESLADVFYRHNRIWFIVQPERHWDTNTPYFTAYFRQHMDVVCEDWGTLVLLRDRNHRTAEIRLRDEKALQDAQANYLP